MNTDTEGGGLLFMGGAGLGLSLRFWLPAIAGTGSGFVGSLVDGAERGTRIGDCVLDRGGLAVAVAVRDGDESEVAFAAASFAVAGEEAVF